MPTYEYRCKRGHTFDAIQRMSDEPLAVCEVCEAPATRVMHPPAVHFKGSGFYNTDYGTRKRAREKSAAESSSGSDGGGSSSASEGKDGGGEKPKPKSSSSEGSGAKPSEKSAPAGAKS